MSSLTQTHKKTLDANDVRGKYIRMIDQGKYERALSIAESNPNIFETNGGRNGGYTDECGEATLKLLQNYEGDPERAIKHAYNLACQWGGDSEGSAMAPENIALAEAFDKILNDMAEDEDIGPEVTADICWNMITEGAFTRYANQPSIGNAVTSAYMKHSGIEYSEFYKNYDEAINQRKTSTKPFRGLS